MLLLHGDADARVGVAQAQRMFAGPDALDRTVHLEVYEGGDHALSDYTEDVEIRIQEWMETHVRPATPSPL